jgi:hypothetical protein
MRNSLSLTPQSLCPISKERLKPLFGLLGLFWQRRFAAADKDARGCGGKRKNIAGVFAGLAFLSE